MSPAFPLDRGARYGLALGGTLTAGYLTIATDFTAFIEAMNYAGSLGNDAPLVDAVEFMTIIGLFIASLVIMPTGPARRVGAVTLACVVLLLWATVGIERGIGNIVEPVDFWRFFTDQGLIAIVVSLGGWLLVRERHPLSFVVLVLAAIAPVVSRWITDASWTSGAYTLITEAVVVVVGIGGAWLAAWIDRAAVRAAGRGSAAPESSGFRSEAARLQ